ncbi:hypothetical protein [uncultured Pedobacter sp.]|uniref:hypothetical protein n=1 Tax=uncultured Pedobacter sp. TaxID=246139 RepID=UPI0025DFA6AC|nr:hypothetical protein [uncultured Pedobacter sp.]
MKNLSINDAFDQLLIVCDRFPASTNESTMVYNYNKLMNILQKKELFELIGNQDQIDAAHKLSAQFGDIAHDIVRGGPKGLTLDTYEALEKEIEDKLSGDPYIFSKQWGLSVKALYFYKKGDYKKAFDFSLECIILNEYLVREGLFTLLFRTAEQNKNIVRVFFRNGDWEKGASLAKDLLSYLFNGDKGGLYGKIFGEIAIWKEIPYVREGYAYECFRAIVSLMIHFEKRWEKKNVDVFSKIFSTLEFEMDTPDRQIISQWIFLFNLSREGKHVDFLREFILFMQDPLSRQYDILKISLFIEVRELLKTSHYLQSEALLHAINNYMEKELNVKEFLKKDISAINLVVLENATPVEAIQAL